MLGDELTLLFVLTLVIDSEGGEVPFGASATCVGDDAREESVSVKTGAEDTVNEAQSWTDDLSLGSTPSLNDVGRAMGNADT